ncbi:MAG: DMT family transporter [Deltaproteobacteria bacterium]
MTGLYYVVSALLAGACGPTQAGINSQLNHWTGDSALTAFISFLVGTICLYVWVLMWRIPWPEMKGVLSVPWWQWTGGLLGAYLVVMAIVLAPKLGATTMIALIVTGQMVTSLLLDHFGLVGYPVRELNISRVVGATLLVVGVLLIRTP